MNDKIVQNRLSKVHEVLTSKLVELQDKGVILITKPANAWHVSALLVEEINKVSKVIVDIKGPDTDTKTE